MTLSQYPIVNNQIVHQSIREKIVLILLPADSPTFTPYISVALDRGRITAHHS